MFNEMVEDIVSILTPPIIPIVSRYLPRDLIVLLCMRKTDLDPNQELYKKFVVSADGNFIYIIYSGEIKNMVFYDEFYYKGKPTVVILISEKIYSQNFNDTIGNITAICSIANIMRKRLYHISNVKDTPSPLNCVELLATFVIPCAVISRILLIDSKEKEEAISDLFNELRISNDPIFSSDIIMKIIKNIQEVGVELLLDNSYIIGDLDMFFPPKNKEEINDESIQEA